MATTMNTIEVPIPETALASREDVEVLAGLLRAIAVVRFDEGHEWLRIRQALERSGWDVQWGLQFHVEARRGRELEQSCGRTLDEAFARVWQVAAADEGLEGAP